MQTWKLVLEYEGTRYSGWQKQPHARTVQGELQKAAEAVLASKVEVGGSGRTDAGVHALRQVAHLKLKAGVKSLKARELQSGINKLLPHDINILQALHAPANFHARHDAVSRDYLYQISTRRTALGKSFVWWVRDELNVLAMKRAAHSLVGRHDFRSFCESTDAQTSTLVHVETAEVATCGSLILFRIGASHFLWKMVRRIAGSLVELGRGNLQQAGMQKLMEGHSNEPAAWTAPPSGLFLERVLYKGEPPPTAIAPAFPVQ
ncbi:MAG TPA: tRNA pseudouridine(38-40) synthase TruA [Pyrinomonadaceae bacterium]|jgi:tRNA pseudouridine38-40 synthase|nr:tRNA pseudouridine(38-40) synthase TruA [Pyrinomonadaceae bacterium]